MKTNFARVVILCSSGFFLGGLPTSVWAVWAQAISSNNPMVETTSNSALSTSPVQPSSGLISALQSTMMYHPALQGKQVGLNVQQSAIDSAEAGRYPSLSAQADNLTDGYKQATLRLQQPLWAFGKIDTAIQQAQADFSTEQRGLLEIQRQLAEETAVAYAKIEGIHQRLTAANTNIVEHERLYQRVERRQKGQLASEADVRLAYSRLIQAKAQKMAIVGEQQVALADLQALTQIEVISDVAIDQTLLALPSMEVVESLALKNSASIGYKQAHIKVAQLNIEKERVAALPTIYLRAERDFLETPNTTNESRVGMVVEGSLDGMGFIAKGRVNGAKALLQVAEYDVDVAENEVRRYIRSLMLNRKVQQLLMVSHQEAVDAVADTMDSFVRQYDSGRKSWVEVLNTQRELTDLRFQLAQSRSEWLIASLRLAALTGGLDKLAGIQSL